MEIESHPLIYNTLGHAYRARRVPDRRIAHQIAAALGDANTICNVGAGCGSYEPIERQVIAVEPSETMIRQRRAPVPVVRAIAENLPFADRVFDAAMAILTVHHWTDPQRGLQEMRRVAQRQIVLAFDPSMVETLWLVRDYLPEIMEFEQQRAVPLEVVVDLLKPARVETVMIPWDCSDGFQGAYRRRPAEYLKPEVRTAISSLSQLPPRAVARAMHRLSDDLRSGSWRAPCAPAGYRNTGPGLPSSRLPFCHGLEEDVCPPHGDSASTA